MFRISLGLRPTHKQPAPSGGWFLPLAEPTSACEYLFAEAEPSDSRRIYLMPTSITDSRLGGIVLLGDADVRLPAGAVALKQRCKPESSTSLWIPADAELSPSVDAEQLQSFASSEAIRDYVWLPSCGLVGCEPGDALAVTDLLSVPKQPENSLNWSAPATPKLLPTRVEHFSLLNPPNSQALFHEESKQVGGDRRALRGIDDSGNPSAGAASWLKKAVAQKVDDVLTRWAENECKRQKEAEQKRATGGTDARKASPPAKPWSAGVAGFLTRAMEKEREGQVDKLLRLMEKDPDRGLRFAIPMNASDSNNAGARSGSQLSGNTPDFSLSSLFGSGPADVWELDPLQQIKLMEAYRKQADREMAIGRYRRAAYIFAHLLGDMRAAASVLEKGTHYGEAAVLFEKSEEPREQARCLKLAGRTLEAANIYERLGDFESAGTAWRDAGNEQLATSAFEKAVDKAIASNDPLNAAKILDGKLSRREEAIELLWANWPEHSTGVAGMKQVFEWYASDGAHGVASKGLESVGEAVGLRPGEVSTLAAHLAANYPDRTLQWDAEDLCRVACAESDLGSLGPSALELQALQSMQHLDSLLRSDVSRFRSQAPKNDPANHPASKISATGLLRRMPMFQIARTGRCYEAEVYEGNLFALGTDHKASVARVSGLQSHSPQVVVRDVQVTVPENARVAAVSYEVGSSREFCLYAKSNGDAGDDRFFGYETISLPNSGVRQTWQLMPAAYTQAIDGCVFTSDITQWVLTSSELIALRRGETRTFDLGAAVIDRDSLAELPPMVAIDSQPFFAIGRSVMTVRDNIAQVHVTANGGVQHLSTSTPHTAPRIAIATDYSLEIAGASGFDHQIVNTGADYSHVRFLHGGRLAAITGRNLEVYQRNSKHVYALRESIQLENEPVASLVTVNVSMLAVVYAEGRVARFTLHA